MYSQSIVDERLYYAAKELGWKPEYHSISEIDKFTEYLRRWERLDSNGVMGFSRNLSPNEFRMIKNEKVLSACDSAYWLTRYARVSDETNTSVRFHFRDAQKIYFDIMSDRESKYLAIELLFGKARQQGITTLTQLLLGHRIFFHNDTNAIDASADRVKSEEMARKLFFAYDNMPWWLKPKYSRRVEAIPGLLEFDTLGSRVSIQHGSGQAKSKGGQRAGIGRGGGFTVYHLSEASAIPKPEQQIDASILKAVHPSPKVFGVIESTFAGSTGWFADKYKAERARAESGLARFVAIFFSFACSLELFPTKTFIAAHPVPGDWKPTGKILEQITKAELFINNDPILSKATFKLDHAGKRTCLGRDWTMPRIQQWWYYVTYTEHETAGAMNTFYQEHPVDDIEAMVSSYDSVFGKEVIEVCHRDRVKKYDVYSIVGQSIETCHEPPVDEIDYDRPRIRINQKSNQGINYEWELVPLRYELYENPTGNRNELEEIDGRLFVFKQPSFRRPPDGESHITRKYGAGVDSGTGQGYDYSAICVTECGDGAIPDVQVAEWRSNKVGHVEVFAFVLPICKYFTDPKSQEIYSHPLVGIEQLLSVGDVCQKEMKRLGYPAGRFFRFGRYDTNKIKQATNKQGWFTTGWSRPILTGNFVYVIRNGWYILNSPWTIEECREFEIHTTAAGKEKFEHSSKSHDDAIFASAISTFIMHDVDTLADRSKRQFHGNTSDLPPINMAPINGHSYNPRVGNENMIRPASIDDILRYSH